VDFGQAALLSFILLGLIDEAKTLVWGTNKERINVGIVNAAAIATVSLVATSAWADEQIVGGKTLGALGWSSLLLVAVVLGGSAGGLWKVLGAVTNIGQNQLTKVQVAALDAGADRLVRAQLDADQGGSHDHAEPGYVFDEQ